MAKNSLTILTINKKDIKKCFYNKYKKENILKYKK